MIDDALPLRKRTLVVLLLCIVALSAFVWMSGAAVTDGEPRVSANVSERYRSVDALTATRSIEIRTNGTTTTRTVADVTLVPGTDRERVRFRQDGSRRYERRVSNGSTLWLYDRDRQTVTTVDLSGPPTRSVLPGRLQRLVAEAGLTDSSGRPQKPAVAPLPVVPRRDGAQFGPATDGEYTVRYVETASVGDREAHVLSVAPRGNRTDAGYRQRLWLDTERFYPLRTQTVWTDDGTRRSVTTTYTDVTFDASVSAAAFRPDIDSETTVDQLESPDTEWYRSADRLSARSSIAVPDPSVPSEFSLTYATRTTGRVRGVGLRYATDGSRLTVAKYNFTYALDEDERDLTIGGRPATLDRGPTTSLSWACGRYRYTVRGTGVETDRLVAVGRSIGCPTA
ncbi:LolA family protein [Halobellus limi]|uniref:Outer membrane lipoprotein-sorting protein n=1 Tax=Halobellus limi TaxID=699433 RepID=A0A1H5UFP1_9EURY|nr:sigma-E factor regulatory protein RseB domain-containing protein [Halobellus limi]SEF73885.1 Outer membrane lipoprotein-sorting protein [Halobellus limi]